MSNMIEQFHAYTLTQLQAIIDHETEAMLTAADVIAESIINECDFLTFGSGHSELVAREAMWRAGGLAPAKAIIDPSGGDVERLEGAAATILGHHQLREGSTIIVISNSGINAVPIEAAMIAKDAGLAVIAITALEHSQAVASRHSSGKKLYDLADITINTHTPRGDSALPLADSDLKAGATSTLAGVFIMESITTQAAATMQERGYAPPVIVSANVPEGDAHNLALKQKYFQQLSRYSVDTADVQ